MDSWEKYKDFMGKKLGPVPHPESGGVNQFANFSEFVCILIRTSNKKIEQN
jgi:hypothetical protein